VSGAKVPSEPPGASVYTIAPHLPFVDTLAAGIVERWGGDPLSLARVRVLLPTRRSCRSLREAFLRLSGGKPTLLPTMTPLGDVDEDALFIGAEAAAVEALGGPLEETAGIVIPPAIGGLRRQLLLGRLVMARGGVTPDQAIHLAGELAKLLDQVHTERLSFERLAELAPDRFADHWREVLRFLTILTDLWPDVLAEEGAIDPADRRNRLLDAQAELWRTQPPQSPIVAAGSTGSIPATADLLKTVAQLPEGAVVLPGLDCDAADGHWEGLEAHHPQFGLARLLDHIGVRRDAVSDWPAPLEQVPAKGLPAARTALMRDALAPPGTASEQKPIAADALAGINRVDCPTSREEAAVIALAIREVLETQGKTVALVTPDRGLARRVTAELARWRIEIDDSAGLPLAQTPPANFLRLTARMIAQDLAPVALLAALKHPLCRCGMAPAAFRAAVRRLEIEALRGPRPDPGLDGLRRALAAPGDDGQQSISGLAWVTTSIEEAGRDFIRLMAARTAPVGELIRAHAVFAEHLCQGTGEADGGGEAIGSHRLWSGDDGEQLAVFLSELADAAGALDDISPVTYPALLDALMSGLIVRPRYGRHPRVHIWGLLEARLQRADLMILAGLNEGTWPPEPDASPWMSRPMMKRFGLPLPERRIGLTAHDFTQAAGAPEVLLTRSERVEGAPSVPSRWLLKLDSRVEAAGLGDRLPARPELLAWARTLDRPDTVAPVPPPRPTPPLDARPRRLSVTRVETWVRNPYAIYAERILGLRPLDPVDADPGAAERGILIHKALERFIESHPETLPDDPAAELIDIGRRVFEEHLVRPGVRAFWWPRFLRIAHWFAAFERDRRQTGMKTVATEASGELTIATGGDPFVLTAKADRVDATADGRLAILDYKTGVAPTAPQVETGLVPQLSLEAAMALDGAFAGIETDTIGDLVYLRLTGGRTPGEERVLKLDAMDVAAKALDGLKRRIAAFDNPKTPYLSRPRPMFEGRFGDYDHLARVREWRTAEGDE